MYDLVIIGGGPAGYHAAELMAQAERSVLLIEKEAIGGVCLNEGCIPSKTLLNSAKWLAHAQEGAAFGIQAENVRMDLPAVIARKDRVVKQLTSGVSAGLKKAGVEVVQAEAQIESLVPGQIRVAAGGQTFEASRLLIATGARPAVPPIPGLKEALDQGGVITSREAVSLETVPDKLVVIGAGVIGLELAGFFNAAGAQVDILEMTDHVAGDVDRETGDALQKKLQRAGIRFHLSATVTQVEAGRVRYTTAEGEQELEATQILLATGRVANLNGFGLEKTGIAMDRAGILVDDRCRTNIPGVYAAGDVLGRWMLAHAAYREAETAVRDMLDQPGIMRYDAVPTVIYTSPEMASVGMTEEQCEDRSRPFKKVVVPMGFSGRFLAETNRETGYCKILADTEENRLLGCHILGPYASEIIVAAGILIETQTRLTDMQELVFPHPTVGEVLREAFFRL